MICLLRQRNNKVIRQQKRNYQTVFFISFHFFSIWIKKEYNDQSRLTTCPYFTRDFAVPTYLVVFMWESCIWSGKRNGKSCS